MRKLENGERDKQLLCLRKLSVFLFVELLLRRVVVVRTTFGNNGREKEPHWA